MTLIWVVNMPAQKPIKQRPPGLGEFLANDYIDIEDGGTGAANLQDAQDNLGIPLQKAINGVDVLCIDDTARSKSLSVNYNTFLWAEAALNDNDWIQIAHASDADSSHIVPLDSTIVGYTLHCENDNGNTKGINLYVNGIIAIKPLITLPGGGANSVMVDMNVNFDLAQGDRLRLRANTTGGTIRDTVITLYTRFRAS